ncbi:MATE family efflux transporter [Psychromonas sp. KJ10-10]|uniref:MATE family efflux transporter n=1 Tax=Psychromonas sp. KJ10-10 TaxID=3391823 RepID=UPI0039B68661
MTTVAPGRQQIFTLAWPIAMNAVLLQLILVIDTVLVTPLGEESLGAMGIAASIAGLILGLLFAFSNGSQLIIAQAHGADNKLAVNKGFRSGRFINCCITGLGIVLIFTVAKPLIDIISDTDAMATLAYDYLKVFSLATVGVALCQNITVYFNATGNSRIPFYANIFELPINVIISTLLIYGLFGFPEMGLTGAALGSAIAVMCRTLFLIVFYTRQQNKQNTDKSVALETLTVADVKHHLTYATPIAGTFISGVMANSLCMLIYAKLGVNQFAALTLLAPWIKVAGHLATAWAQATSIIVGQLLGKKSWGMLDTVISKAWVTSFIISIFMSLAYLAMFYLFEVIYPELQTETVSTLWQFMPILVILPFIRASNTFCGNVLRAGGDAKHVFKIHAYTQWLVIVPLSAIFVLYLNLSAVWVFGLMLLEETIKGVPFHIRMLGGKWKRSLV